MAGFKYRVFDAAGITLASTPPSQYGRWLTGAFVELLEDGRRVRMWDVLSFMDSMGMVWAVAVGFISDVSSHPQFTWSFFGGPLSGKYRRAAILHDWLLAIAARHDGTMTVQRAHEIFREAMLADGVSEKDADVFFTAVVGATWWKSVEPMLSFFKSSWRVLRRFVGR